MFGSMITSPAGLTLVHRPHHLLHVERINVFIDHDHELGIAEPSPKITHSACYRNACKGQLFNFRASRRSPQISAKRARARRGRAAFAIPW
jgi:hypothetical protein